MINYQLIENRDDKLKLFSGFDPENTTWVVSDLKSKLILMERLLETREAVADVAIMRASEFWKRLFLAHFPMTHLISFDLATQLISQLLKKSSYSWAKSESAASQMVQFISQFVTVFCHPEGRERIGDWYRLNVESYIRWGEWFLEAELIFNELRSMNLLASAWIPAFLAGQPNTDLALLDTQRKRLIVDLGPDLTTFESELFIRLGSNLEIDVVVPNLEYAYSELFEPYRMLGVDRKNKVDILSNQKVSTRRFATMLSEVKDITAQVRNWRDLGIPKEKIAIVAPDIKKYLIPLKSYFKTEGIELRADDITVLADLPPVATWLSELSLRTREVTTEDLESAVFQANERMVPTQYERFRSLYARIYGNEDLLRDDDVAKYISGRPLKAKELLNRSEFIKSSMAFWPREANFEYLEKIASHAFRDASSEIQMTPSDWTTYFRSICSKIDHVLDRRASGVQLIDLDSTEDLSVACIYFAGLSEGELLAKSSQRVDPRELMSISAQTGFLFSNNDQSRLEFKARWLIRGNSETVMSFAALNFDGDLQSPSTVWLEKALDQIGPEALEKTCMPQVTRWDTIQIQNTKLADNSDLVLADREKQRLLQLKRDSGREILPNFALEAVTNYSASSIEDFQKCPMIFAAKRIFKLSDLPDLDLEADPMTRGQLIHKVLEIVVSEGFEKEWSDTEIERVLIKARDVVQPEMGDPRIWKILSRRLQQTVRDFIAFERIWKDLQPRSKTVGTELEIKGAINPESGELKPEAERREGDLTFRGYIDRVESDGAGRTLVIDYKSSKGELTNVIAGIKKRQFQLPLYALALQKGLSSLGRLDVVGAFYYFIRDFNRSVGFRVAGESDELVGSLKSKTVISSEEMKSMMSEMQNIIKTTVDRVRSGDFVAKPYDEKQCTDCEWSQVCRAPHLN